MEQRYRSFEVQNIIRETSEAKTFVLSPLDEAPLDYRPGQFITLVFETPHGHKRRSYSITSLPGEERSIHITVKKMDNGEFSRYLVYQVKKGDILRSSGIAGFFVLPEDLPVVRQIVFIAAGSGIAPCFPLILQLLGHTEKKIVLIYSNRSEKDTIFYRSLRSLEEKYKARFRIKFLFSDIQNVYESRLSNWLLPQLLNAYQQAKDSEMLFYVCGPFDYMRMVEITLRSRFLPEQIVKENFDHTPRLILPEPPDHAPRLVKYSYNGVQKQVVVQYPESILATIKRNGELLPFSCEAGRCGACTATCVRGNIWMAYNEVLTEKEIAAGRILTCQAFPINGDAEIIVD